MTRFLSIAIVLSLIAACDPDPTPDPTSDPDAHPLGPDASDDLEPPIDLPPGGWADAGLDPVGGARDELGCATGELAGRRYLYVDAAAATGGDGSRQAPW